MRCRVDQSDQCVGCQHSDRSDLRPREWVQLERRPNIPHGPRVTVGIPAYNRAEWLRDAIDSVLSQSFGNFRLIVSDNASDDATPEVVASFDDARLHYVRASHNVGMIGNMNRLIELADTEFVMLLPDDDLLYPDYLQAVIDTFERFPTVGVVHTAFDEVDDNSRVSRRAVQLMKPHGEITFESGEHYLERGMASRWTLCFSSAMYRRRAIVEAGGLNADEEPFADVPMWMRIALEWDFAFLARTLAGFRLHSDTVTLRLGTNADGTIDDVERVLLFAQIMFERRAGFLATAPLPSAKARRYHALARLSLIVERSGLIASWTATTLELLHLVGRYPRIILQPTLWRLVLAQLGGRWMRRKIRRLAR